MGKDKVCAVGDRVYAVVKTQDFRLGVVDGVVYRMNNDTIEVEHANSALNSTVYTFPAQELGRSIQWSKEAAEIACEAIVNEQRPH